MLESKEASFVRARQGVDRKIAAIHHAMWLLKKEIEALHAERESLTLDLEKIRPKGGWR